MWRKCTRCNHSIPSLKTLFDKNPVCAACRDRLAEAIRIYERKVGEVAADDYLSRDEERELTRLVSQLNLTGEEVAHTSGMLERLRRLRRFQEDELPAEKGTSILLRKNEVCHLETVVSLAEARKRVKYVGGSRGVSLRLAKGVSYRVGAFSGDRIESEANEVTDTGILTITNRRIVFSGQRKNVTYQIPRIVGISKFNNAIQFQKENESKPKYFLIQDPIRIDEIGVLVHRLVAE